LKTCQVSSYTIRLNSNKNSLKYSDLSQTVSKTSEVF